MNIVKQLTPAPFRAARVIKPTSVTLHNTGNLDAGADALRHARAQAAGNLKNVAVHYYVDDSAIYQCLEDTWQGWHAGDGSNPGGGNATSIGIEVCEHKGINQRRAFELAAELTCLLMEKHNITVLKKHQDWTGKRCPHILLEGKNGLTWDWFIELCQKGNQTAAKPSPAPVGPPSDSGTPSDWAQEAWMWAQTAGYMDGVNPKGAMTREMMATILHRLYLAEKI